MAAKLLELVCVASLTTVVLHVLRHDLIREGVPLGFVGSGIFFSQVNFFWGPEIYVGALHCVKSWKKLRLLLVIIVAGVLAVTIAPSAAILLQPRPQHVPAGGTEYFLPVTPDELWPSVVDGTDELQECFDQRHIRHVVCASGGFESLRTYFQNFNSSLYLPITMLGFVQPRGVIFQSAAAKIPRLLSSMVLRGLSRETNLRPPNAMTATIQESLAQDWYDIVQSQVRGLFSARKNYVFATERISSVSTVIPTVGIRCSTAQNISTDLFSVNFPVKLWVNRIPTPSQSGSSQWQDEEAPFNVTTIHPQLSDELQIDWVSLPTDRFGPVSGGVYLQFPRQLVTRSWAVIGCSISANWIHAEIGADSLSNDGAWSVIDSDQPKMTVDLVASSEAARKYPGLITLKERWYRSLTPPLPSEDRTNQSRSINTLQRLFSDVRLVEDLVAQRTQPHFVYDEPTSTCIFKTPHPNTTDVDRLNNWSCGGGSKNQLIEFLLGSVFVNGLSRYGSRRASNLAASLDARRNPFTWILKKPPQHQAMRIRFSVSNPNTTPFFPHLQTPTS